MGSVLTKGINRSGLQRQLFYMSSDQGARRSLEKSDMNRACRIMEFQATKKRDCQIQDDAAEDKRKVVIMVMRTWVLLPLETRWAAT